MPSSFFDIYTKCTSDKSTSYCSSQAALSVPYSQKKVFVKASNWGDSFVDVAVVDAGLCNPKHDLMLLDMLNCAFRWGCHHGEAYLNR